MGVFLLILKIIGIILLSILGLILIILITPIRYRIKGGYKDDRPDVLVNVSIWLHLISFNMYYTEKGLSGRLRILFIKLNIIKPKDDKKKADEPISELYDIAEDSDKVQKPLEDELSEEVKDNSSVIEDKATSDIEQDLSKEDVGEEKADEGDLLKDNEEPETIILDEDNELQEKDENIVDRIYGIVCKLIEKCRVKLEGLIGKKNNLAKKKYAIEWLLKQPATIAILPLLKKQLIKLLKSILPKKISGRLRLGLDDPKTMGMICMYTGVFYPEIDRTFDFEPVFDEKIIDGDGDIKGRVIIGALLAHLLRIVCTPNFFRTLKNLKRFKKLWR